jgi:SdrD B-like domain/Secretion system C-terminal sorting domain
MKSLQHLFSTLVLAVSSIAAQAQVNITATPPPPTAPLNVCGAPAHFRVLVTCAGPSAANSPQLTVQMPTGIRYVPGSIVRVAGVSGAITENASNTSAAVFSLPNLAVGSTIELDYQAEADCRRINEPVNSTNYKMVSSAGTQTFLGGTISNQSYNVQYAAMNIVNMTNSIFGGTAGATFTRSVTVLNGGFGSTPTLRFDASHTSGLVVQSVTVTGASSIVAATPFPAGSNTYTISGFTGDGFMDNNDVVTITETLVMPATSCGGTAGSSISNYKASYGCFAQNICPETNSTDISSAATASASWSGATAGGGSNILINSLLPIATSCLSDVVNYEIKFTNIGTEAATNVMFTFDARDIKLQYLTGFLLDGVAISPINTVLPTVGGAACFASVPAGAVYSGKFNLPNIPPGQTITLDFSGKRCCNTNFCYANNSPYSGFNGNLTYADACNPNKVVGKKLYGAPAKPESSTIFTASQIKDLVVYLQRDSTNFFCADLDIVVPKGDNTGYLDFTMKMPLGYTYKPGTIATLIGDGAAWPVTAGFPTFVDSILTFRFSLAQQPTAFSLQEHNALRICMPVSAADDDVCSDETTFRLNANYVANAACPTCAIKLFCTPTTEVTQYIERICVRNAPNCPGKFKSKKFTLARTSFGQVDNNNDNVPDASGTLRLDSVRQHDIIIGDSIQVNFTGYIKDSSATAALGFDHGFLNIFFEKGLINAAPISLGASAVIYDASTGNSIAVNNLVPTIIDAGDSRRFIYDLNTGAAAGFHFENSDTVYFNGTFAASAQNQATLVKVRPTLFLTNDAGTNGDSGDCFGLPNYFYLHPIKTSTAATIKRAPNACATDGYVEAVAVTSIENDFGADLFDYEVRKTAYETDWAIDLPPGVNFDFAEVKFHGDYDRQNSAWFPIPNATFAAGTVSFNLKSFYKQFGGTIENWEDRNRVEVHVHYTGANPSCGTTGSSQKFISNREYANPIKGVRPTESVEINYAFNPAVVGSTVLNMLSSDDLSSVGDTVTWMIRVANTATGTLSNTWLAKKTGISSVNIAQVRLLNCATGQPTGAALPLVNGFYQIGDVTSAGVCLAVKATFANCIKDSVTLVSGFNCGGYPTSINNVNLLCGVVEQQLFVRPAPTQIQQIITQEPAADISLCDEFGYKIAILSAQKGSVNSIKTSFVVLPGQGVIVVPNSSQVEYPHNSGNWVTIPNPVLAGSTYTWDISNAPALAGTIGARGLLGIDSALVNKNRLNLRFRLTTTPCNFKSGVVFVFQTQGKRGCGQIIKSTDQVTSPIKIIGAPVAVNTYSVNLTTGTARPCNNQTARMRVAIVNQGGGANGGLTSTNENIEIVFYNGADVSPFSFNAIRNAPNNTPDIETVPGGKVYRYTMPANVMVGDSIVFEADVIVNNNLACGVNATRVEVSTNSLFSSTCSTNAQVCTLASNTGSDVGLITIVRPDLQIVSINATSTLNPPTGETITAVIRLRNNGTTPVVASVPFVLKMYNDADRSGTVSAGDVLLATRTVAATILQNANYDVTITQDVAAGLACPLLVSIEEAPCFCNITALTTTNVPLTPATTTITTCQGVTTNPLGAAPVAGYTYQWVAITPGAISFLSNPNIANPTFTNSLGSNQDFEYILYVSRGAGCLASQKFTVHLDYISACAQYKGSIGNYVWFDDNEDGIQNEPATRGINGVSVELNNAGADGNIGTGDDFFETTTVTTNNAAGEPGYYLFANLNTGVYYVRFPTTVPGAAGLRPQTTAINADNDSDADPITGVSKPIRIDVFAGVIILKDNPTIDAGYKADTQVGDFVWLDTNKDGLQDAGEAGIPNVFVYLIRASDNVEVARQQTDTNGKYLFSNLVPDTYYIVFDKPLGNYTASPSTINTADGSDADPITGRTSNFTLIKGQANLDIDAGFYNTTLPVKLLSFEGRLNACTIELKWATATEINNAGFELFASADGLKWKTIGTVRGAGSTNIRQDYTFTHDKPAKNNFYKLVQKDFDGKTETFVLANPVDATPCYKGIENGASIFPNPNASNLLTFKFGNEYEAETVEVNFTDLSGRLVKQIQTEVTEGPNALNLNITDLPAGAYLVRIKGNGWFSDVQKLVRIAQQ